ncbi:Protein S40-3 [Cardamine amara subsp. amara]|uniref:Protein S40-3 n=1 Tax=Cardamine amara subsp. amara TaxID=228776 RepID=A0ABD1C5K8_CARAN
MSEEFQESDVIFSDEYFTKNNNNKSSNISEQYQTRKSTATKKKSSPVEIPSSIIFRCTEEEEGEAEGEMTPPHIIIGKRRTEAQMAFSFCTLKGRDLRRHRNSVLRMTGFLEV